MRNKLKQTLTSLWTGELASVLLFWGTFFHFKGNHLDNRAFIAIFYSLLILSLILVQGAVYWMILIKRLSDPQFGENTVGSIYRVLKISDMVLICLGIPLHICLHNSAITTLISSALLIFAFVEWVNYFQWRLSYSYNPVVVIRYTIRGKLKKSKIAKEIETI
ncbi:MAG: hypothetical protein J5684_00345 [Eubacterium sp.]|nr:hypothetical protein [Eubacterium sp.]